MIPQNTTSSSHQIVKPTDGFSLAVAAMCTFGYLLATVPPSILDPLLTTHVLGARHYQDAWLIYPIALILFLVTLPCMSYAATRQGAVLLSTIPLLGAYLVSLPIFRPEIPNGNILFVGTIWFCITAGWMWIHYTPTINEKMLSSSIDVTARVEYIKEELTFIRTFFFGLGVAYIGLLVAQVTAFRDVNESIVTARKETFLIDVNSGFQVCSISIFLLVTVFRELYKKREQISGLFATIQRDIKEEI